MKDKQIKILDCTLRDGGYYNNWDFDHELVELYLKSMEDASIDIIEIGFRSPPKRSFMGPYVYALDDHLESLPLPKNILIGVMINAKDYLNESEGPPSKMINKLFQPREKSPVGLVRVAINFDQVLEAEVLVHHLKNLGYQIGLNMMQSHGKEELQYKQAAKRISEWDSVDVLYFADSLGNMDPSQIKFICKSLLSVWHGPLGIHTHNNKDLALINSLTALGEGVTWCDSTITGMGRGAGNVSTEALLMEATHLGFHSGNSKALTPCIKRFDDLKKKYNWGSNSYYHYAANHNIHPTFVQFLLNDPRYYPAQIDTILESLAQKYSTSFSETTLRETIYGTDIDSLSGTWDATGWLKERDVLLIGTGPSVGKYRQAILNYIQKFNPAVLFLNVNPHLPNNIADATVVSHGSRALFEAGFYSELGHPLIMPLSRLKPQLGIEIEGTNVLDYGLTLKKGSFDIGPTGCILQWPLAIAYALSVVCQASANKIMMVGFDGYESNDPRQEEMNEILASYNKLPNHLPLKSLTPTNYPIQQGSIFEPVI